MELPYKRPAFSRVVAAARATAAPLVFLPSDMPERASPMVGVSADVIIRAFRAQPPEAAGPRKVTADECDAAERCGGGLGRGGGEEPSAGPVRASPGACAQCGAAAGGGSAVRLSACARCKKVRYCGRACQAAHWKAGHKKTCVLAEP
jgi:hypothetical protein